MSDRRKKKKAASKPSNPDFSPAKKRIFWIVTVSLPIFLFIILEVTLRIFNYGGNLDLFIDGPEGYENYLRCNPNVARRYFYAQTEVPTPPLQLFSREKTADIYRIFILGESSAAGFPYSNNASFPNILRRGLSNAFPDKNIEVINVSMAAINSYTLLDLLDEIIEKSPDALLIYTGHNEYYGAMGVGSVQSLGNWRWLINTYLELQSFKSFILLRDFLGWIKTLFSNVLYEGDESDPSATLMERIVGEQTIPYRSSLYEQGKEQFKGNLRAIISKAAENNIKVIAGELVSNLKDQPPFISVKDSEGNSAEKYYDFAVKLEAEGEFEKAKENYIKAKDYDALRFRAPEDFNEIIRNIAEEYSITCVDIPGYFEKESPNGIIGDNLMLEHLHPNKEGYFLIAKAFYDAMKKNKIISEVWPEDSISQERNKGITALDSVYAALVVRHLKGGWPFQPKSLPNKFVQNFKPANHLEEIAFRIFPSDNFNLEAAHMELGKIYEKDEKFDKAFEEYYALIISIPHESEFYQKAATVLLKEKKYEKAGKILRESLKYKYNSFAYKWIGQIALMDSNYSEAISYLSKSDLNDSQVLFNLSRAYYMDNQWGRGEEYFNKLNNISPNSEYAAFLKRLRIAVQMNKKNLK